MQFPAHARHPQLEAGSRPSISGPTADVGYLSAPQAHREGGMEPRYAGLAVDAQIRKAACELVQA